MGAVGFCMSGGLVVSLARALPERVAAVASIHGAWMVRDTPDSPHLGLDTVRAEVHLAWCDDDPTAPPETVPVFRQALEDAGVDLHLRPPSPTRSTASRPAAPATTGTRRSCTGSGSTRSSAATSPAEPPATHP